MVRLCWNKKQISSEDILKYKSIYKSSFEPVKIFKPVKSFKPLDTFSNPVNEWENKLFWGDNLKIFYHLLNSFEEKIDLVYIDPPFFSGSNYNIVIKEENQEPDYETTAYYDKWNNDIDNYLQMLYTRLILMKRLLSQKGLIFVHLDWHSSHYIRLILDDIFGTKRYINSIIWYYYNKYSASKTNLPRAHDEILVYSKGDTYTLNELRILRKKPIKQLKREMINGVLKNAKDENGNIIYRIVKDKKLDDVWRIPCMQPASKQWTGYPTQKHHKLLERIIKLGTNKGDLVADFFCGSGTTLYAAEKLNRRWIGADNSKYAIYLTLKRIINYQKKNKSKNVQFYPFEFLTHLNENKKNIINSDFFDKELMIKRKK